MKTNKNLERMADKAKKDSDSMAKRMAEFRLAIANIDTVVQSRVSEAEKKIMEAATTVTVPQDEDDESD